MSIGGLLSGQSGLVLGVEFAALGLLLWVLQTLLMYRSFSREHPRPTLSVVLSQIATLRFLIAGISLAMVTFGGLYWLALGVILSITVGVSNAWVLPVEILR